MNTAEDSNQMTREPARVWDSRDAPGPGGAARNSDASWAMLGYLGAIFLSAIFLGPLIPLLIWLGRRNKSPFLRYHASRAVNLSLTGLIYAVCCAIVGTLLALDQRGVALAVALPLLLILWIVLVRYLVRGALAAQRGEPYELPDWICATFVRLRAPSGPVSHTIPGRPNRLGQPPYYRVC